MTLERGGAHGPTWRAKRPETFHEERTLIVCRCGVDMQFEWHRGLADVRCFGCGARYLRPVHLPPPVVLPEWRPPTQRSRLTARLRALATPGVLAVLGLIVLAAALAGLGAGLLIAG